MITIVLGMHRSGTSVVAGILHFNKVSMGTYETFWPRPLPQNPKGFYENFLHSNLRFFFYPIKFKLMVD